MKAAACWSITAARLARLASAAINSRSTATVESRSSQKAIGKFGALGEIAREGARRLRARALRSVHVERQAEHEADRAPLRRERQDPVGIDGEGLARDGFDAGREPAVRIGGGDADRLGAEVEPDQGAARRQMRRGFFQRQDQGRHWRAVALAPTRGQDIQPARLIARRAITMLRSSSIRREFCPCK